MADLSKTIKGGLSAVRNLTRSADEKLEAQRLAREAANPPIKASEAYGKHEGSYLKPIFYDRMKVDLSKGKFGGPGFSGIQLVDPNYANAKAVAGVTDQKMATRILNRNKALVPKDAKVIWTPSVGGLEQHKSNSTMFGEFADIFANQRKNMSAEEIQKLSDRASNMTDNKGRLIFPSGIDLGARNFRQQVKTYDQRALMADIFAGRGVGGEKGRTVPVEELLEKNLDPNMAGAGTLDLGNRLFRLEGDVIDRPDLHSDYRKILTGEDLDVNYLPVPIRDVYSDWEAQKALELAAQGKKRPVTQMDYTKNDPTVLLTEELLSRMQKAGYKDGGAVDDAPDLTSYFDKRIAGMAKGGEVGGNDDLTAYFDKRMGMAGGGKAEAVKGVAKGFKRLFGETEAPAYSEIAGMVSKVGEEGRSPIIPVPNRWFLQPDKFPNQQKLIERVLQKTGKGREEFTSGAFIDPRTGEVLDSRIMDDLGVVIDPKTNRPMMSAKGQSGIEQLDPKTGAYTKSNLVRKGLFKPEGGDPLLNDLNFLATIEKGDVGHKYGLATEYASPTELFNTGTGANPTLRPRSRGDLFGVGDVVGQVRVGRSEPHDVYEKLFVAPKGSDVQGKKLSKADGGAMAEGGPAFKKLQFMAGGGITTSGGSFSADDLGVTDKELNAPLFSAKRLSDIKKNASEMFDETKQSLASDYDRLKNSARARAQLAKIAAAQIAGGGPDLAHLGVDLVLDPLKSVTVDKLLTKPAYRSVLEGPLKPGEKQERVPMFGSLSDSLKTADGYPIGGSEHLIKRAQDAGLMSQGRFSPLMEIPAAILTGVGASKLGKGIVKGVSKQNTTNSGKLLDLQPEAKTVSTGTPQGATYATKQDGPFYRVSPTSLDLSGAKSRGLREADELQGQAPVGGTAGEAGREVPSRISDEEVARLIADPASNQPLQIAQRFTKETQGTDFVVPEIPESSLAKQSAIGRAHQLAVEGSPEYKSAVFDAYAKQMPDLLEQVGAKDYDDLMEKAYRQLAKETDEQFKQLPYNFSYHRAGEGDYKSSKEMMADVHGNKHLYVFQGGDPHDFLNRIDKATGLNENEKFRAVHDLLGHGIYGNQFGPKGEELAYAVHQQMYSPLARLAMASETRGQNSLVNYSPLNVKLKTNIAKLEDLEYEAMRRKDTALVNEIRAAKRQEFANNFQFAPQKAVLLPPEFIDPKFTGGMPDYLSAANRPVKGTESQSVLTHFSNSPDLQLLDPKKYGTGIKGAEAERLRDYEGGVRDRSYVYLGEPGTIAPEPGLGVHRYRGESQNLYDITKDPLGFRPLARQSSRVPITAKYNQGMTYPLQEANDYERRVKEYGYEGMINPNASKPMGIMFKPTPVQPRARGGLTQLKAR